MPEVHEWHGVLEFHDVSLGLFEFGGKTGPVWHSLTSLLWDLPDTEFKVSVSWQFEGLGVIELSIGGLGAFSSDTFHGEGHVYFLVWDGDLKAETFFHPVDWGGGNGFEVEEV